MVFNRGILNPNSSGNDENGCLKKFLSTSLYTVTPYLAASAKRDLRENLSLFGEEEQSLRLLLSDLPKVGG